MGDLNGSFMSILIIVFLLCLSSTFTIQSFMKTITQLIFFLFSLFYLQCSLAQTDTWYQENTKHTLSLKEGGTSPTASIQDIAWYTGRWVGTGFGGEVEENFGPPMGESMIGTFRMIQEEQAVFYEFLTIVEEKGSLAYKVKHFNPDLTGWEAKDKYVTFPLVKIEGQTAWFEGMTLKRVGEELTIYLAMKDNGEVKEETLLLKLANPSTTDRPAIAITIDDLPGVSLDDYQEVTTNILTTLKKYEVPAIGFVNEGKLYPKKILDKSRLDLLEDWLEAGMELGNHTYGHPDYNRLNFEAFSYNIIKGEKHTKQLQAEHGQAMRYFRHPFLHTGNSPEKKEQLEQFLAEQGYEIAPVTIDNSEWIFAKAYHVSMQDKDIEQMKKVGASYVKYMEAKTAFFEEQSKQLFGRPIKHILLIHANALNGDYLDELLAMYQQRGYQFISLEEALKDPAYQSKDEYAGPGGITWLHRWAITQKVNKAFFKGEPSCPEFIQAIAGYKE